MAAIHWFRKGLRIHDNPALVDACKRSSAAGATVFPVFFLDPWFVEKSTVGPVRWRFLLEALTDLDKSLRKLNSRLFVVRGSPAAEFPRLIKQWGVGSVTFELDTEPYSKKRDAEVGEIVKQTGAGFYGHWSHTLYDQDKLLARLGGKPVTSYGSFLKAVSSMGCPARPVATVDASVLVSMGAFAEEFASPAYDVPTMAEMLTACDPDTQPVLFPGGETEALARLEKHLKRKEWISRFEKPKTSPTALSPSTTVLSPYLKFGCLSPRLFFHKLQEIYAVSRENSKPPVSLEGQLYWREFYYVCGHVTENYDKMEGNPICRQIPWKDNDAHLKAWREGRTGYPWIDAAMNQLRQEGWIHHLARHAVACFLTRGDLWISWEKGASVFDELLIDADWSINNGNWMWLSCSCFFYQYFRCYSPVAFPKKTDKNGDYIRKYVPALSKMPAKYIYEPWKAPLAVQKGAKCVVGTDYPERIVEHEVVSKQNMARMKEAYDQHKANAKRPASSSGKSSSTNSKRQKT